MTRPPVGSTGTLAELQVEPGDLVEWLNDGGAFEKGRLYTIDATGTARRRDGGWIERDNHFVSMRLISRANPAHIVTHEGRTFDLTAPEAVERFTPDVIGSKGAWPDMTPHRTGGYVRYADYAALSAALEDELVKRLRTSPWCQPMKREAADRIEALEAALAEMTRRRDHWKALAEGQDFTRVYLETCAERDALRAELADAVGVLRQGHDLIESDAVGADWKRGCHDFTKEARAFIARHQKETDT